MTAFFALLCNKSRAIYKTEGLHAALEWALTFAIWLTRDRGGSWRRIKTCTVVMWIYKRRPSGALYVFYYNIVSTYCDTMLMMRINGKDPDGPLASFFFFDFLTRVWSNPRRWLFVLDSARKTRRPSGPGRCCVNRWKRTPVLSLSRFLFNI